MLRLLYYAMLAYFVYVVYKFLLGLGRRLRPSKPAPRLSGMMVKDEACETYVPKEEAIREVIDGKEYFFCSKDCRRKFLDKVKNSD
jgi:YHS domain-containing protein